MQCHGNDPRKMNSLEQYCELLSQYYILIDENWFDGRREELVKRMDSIWSQMSDNDRRAAIVVSEKIYQKRING